MTKKHRTQAQNRYLWGVVYQTIVDWCDKQGIKTNHGYEIIADHIHIDCKNAFLPDVDSISLIFRGSGRKTYIHQSTRHLTTQEFHDYVTAIQAFFAEKGLEIPDPDEEIKKHALIDGVVWETRRV